MVCGARCRVEIINDTVNCCEKLSYTLANREQVLIATPEELREQVQSYAMHSHPIVYW